ncbi:Protein GLUTAMINE DUMPER 1 [Striga hermonthica]|uniref:Protein GLUTAMINE DUMPER 1 n=1 Tax=Striga hermonthica TaxID=68872 RepID=A0A9N7N3R3_STRHE|nr:Protein GLUTAMINE DUMPER 1 [Striga hermonthica]
MDTSTLESLSVADAVPPPPAQPSPWESPVLYLFGVLSVVVGLIAFAILILVTSYKKLTAGNLDRRYNDVEAREKSGPQSTEEKYLVIMAGQEKPSFLATPAMWSSREVVCSNC